MASFMLSTGKGSWLMVPLELCPGITSESASWPGLAPCQSVQQGQPEHNT